MSDIIVELTCGILWGIPREGEDHYSRQYFPKIAPFFYAISHMAVMTSNYITGIIGFERYVRLKYYCNFKYRSWITNGNINVYRALVVIFPILFYAPKFFEVEANFQVVNCITTFLEGYDDLRRLFQRLLIEKKYADIWPKEELDLFLMRLNFSR